MQLFPPASEGEIEQRPQLGAELEGEDFDPSDFRDPFQEGNFPGVQFQHFHPFETNHN